MSRPGERVYSLAVRCCSAKTVERLIEPLVADIQIEYADAVELGRPWRARWIWLRGYGAIAQLLALHLADIFTSAAREWNDEDRYAFGRTLGFAVAAILTSTVVLEFRPLFDFARNNPAHTWLLLYLIPQGLPMTVPVGVTVGAFCGLRRHSMSGRLKVAVFTLACVASLASVGTMRWITPATNQAFRAAVGGEDVVRGPNEMSLTELQREIDAEMGAGRVAQARRLALIYETRCAFPFAPLVLALLAVSISWRPKQVAMMITLACGVCVVYFVLASFGETLGREGTLPAFAAMWMPNAVFLFAALGCLAVTRGRSSRLLHG